MHFLTSILVTVAGEISARRLERQTYINLLDGARNVAGDIAMVMMERYNDLAALRDLLEQELRNLSADGKRAVLDRTRASFTGVSDEIFCCGRRLKVGARR
ncbi:MAG: hypothetical protein G8237_03325 [Magnetococcales bacterium]|nr:hypothetical protein [Magnetococcales bacterium]